jgi:hypothetical protein
VLGICAVAALLSAVLSAPANAAELLWAGTLNDADGPFDGNVTAIFTVTDGDGAEVASFTESSLEVVAGDFVVALDVPARDDLVLSIVINGASLEPPAALPTSWARAARADTADTADRAEVADAVGAVANPLTIAGLGSAGFPFANVTDFPSGFEDGDDGIEFTAGDTISFAGGVVSIAPGTLTEEHVSGTLAGADLAPQTLTDVDFEDGGLGVGRVFVTGHVSIADATLSGRHMSGTKVDVFQVVESGCSEVRNSFTTRGTCNYTNVGACVVDLGEPLGNVAGTLGCPANPVCNLTATSQCPNPRVGVLVFP